MTYRVALRLLHNRLVKAAAIRLWRIGSLGGRLQEGMPTQERAKTTENGTTGNTWMGS